MTDGLWMNSESIMDEWLKDRQITDELWMNCECMMDENELWMDYG
jgi:hypothetical protein